MDRNKFKESNFEGHLEIIKALPKSFIMKCKTTGETFKIYPSTLGDTTLTCPICKAKIYFNAEERDLPNQTKRTIIDTDNERLKYFQKLVEERYVNYREYNTKERNNLRGKIHYNFNKLKDSNPELVDNCDTLQEYLMKYYEDKPDLLERKIYER